MSNNIIKIFWDRQKIIFNFLILIILNIIYNLFLIIMMSIIFIGSFGWTSKVFNDMIEYIYFYIQDIPTKNKK